LFSKWPIRVKLLVGLSLLVLVVAALSGSGLVSTYSYRDLVNSLSWRVNELPLAAELSRRVGDLRITLSELRGLRASAFDDTRRDQVRIRQRFCQQLDDVKVTLNRYRYQ
jgi:hypothetical protein